MRSFTTNSVLLAATFAAISTALPATISNVLPRAGGPPIVPLPPACSVTNPLPASSYIPGPSTNDAILYRAYYPSFSTNKTLMAEQCLQQCYGYGYHIECKTAFWAENIPTPAGWLGTPGGSLSTGCLMYDRPLTSGDFVAAPEGQATDAFAGNIAC